MQYRVSKEDMNTTEQQCCKTPPIDRQRRCMGSRTLRHRDTSASQNWCRSLSRITGGAVSHRNCPRSKCPGFSSITALLSKCLETTFLVSKCLEIGAEVSQSVLSRSVLWPKCPVTGACVKRNLLAQKTVI